MTMAMRAPTFGDKLRVRYVEPVSEPFLLDVPNHISGHLFFSNSRFGQVCEPAGTGVVWRRIEVLEILPRPAVDA